MANPDHLNMLRQGVDAWNAWRGHHPVKPDLNEAYLMGADLSGANLSGATLIGASLVDADITNADLTGCRVYGVSAWNVKLSGGTRQQGLVITVENEPDVTVDNIEVAQFIYLMLNNQKI